MAPDGVHHPGGSLSGGEFRPYLYDNFTRPMDARRFRARVGNYLSEPEPRGEYLRVLLDEIATDRLAVMAFVALRPDGREDRFAFIFMPPAASPRASESLVAHLLSRRTQDDHTWEGRRE